MRLSSPHLNLKTPPTSFYVAVGQGLIISSKIHDQLRTYRNLLLIQPAPAGIAFGRQRRRGKLLVERLFSIYCRMEKRKKESELRIMFIGAGGINFGGVGMPWNHSQRLERLGGVRVVAIADVDVPKARAVLEGKLAGPSAELYSDCAVYASYQDAIRDCKPDVALIGVPPHCHGSFDPPLDIELQCVKAGLHTFVEKPVSLQPLEKVGPYTDAVEKLQKEKGLVVAVGYMFRYHPAVEKMRSILAEHGRKVISINARYNCTYSTIEAPFWWDNAKSGGPVVHQSTHLVDLLCYFGGEVVMESLSALIVGPSDDPDSAGYLSSVPEVVQEQTIPLSRRVPRLTNAHWRFVGGGVGSLTHGATLQGKKYETAIDIWADGLRMTLQDPYFPECTLSVRRGNTDAEEVFHFPDIDAYYSELKAFLTAVRSRDPSLVRCDYRDGAQTYGLTWAIRKAGEQSC